MEDARVYVKNKHLIPSYPFSAAYAATQRLTMSEEGKDLAMILIESGINIDELRWLSENQIRNIFVEMFSGKYSSSTGKNVEIERYMGRIKSARAPQKSIREKLDPTNDILVIR